VTIRWLGDLEFFGGFFDVYKKRRTVESDGFLKVSLIDFLGYILCCVVEIGSLKEVVFV
jgi:hypothetical protein